MSFLDNFSLWNELHTKNQRANPTAINRKIRKKLFKYLFILSIND